MVARKLVIQKAFQGKLSFCSQITFKNEVGQYDLEVTTFQLAVLFAWNQRPREKISFENLKLATELPDAELRRTLWVFYFLLKQISSWVFVLWSTELIFLKCCQIILQYFKVWTPFFLINRLWSWLLVLLLSTHSLYINMFSMLGIT